MAPPPAFSPSYGLAPQFVYGGFWIRFVAIVIDSIIVAVITFVVAVILGILIGILTAVAGTEQSLSTSNTAQILAQFVAFVISVGYFVYSWGMGSTPAMRLFRLSVVDANTGQPIGFGRAALRYLGYVISALPCYVGLIWAAFDPRKQGWHDKIANSVVIQG